MYLWRCVSVLGRHGSVAMLKELSAVAQQLRQFDVEGGLVGMLASLVTASHEFIGIADLQGNALFVNEAGRKLVGLRDLEAVLATRIIDYSRQTTSQSSSTWFCPLSVIRAFGRVN